jgi:hypothetical protein
MKKFGIISGLILLIILTGSFSLEAQRGMRRMMMDSTRVNRIERGFEMNQGMNRMPDSLRMKGIRHGFGTRGMYRMGPGMYAGHGFGMRRQMLPGPMMHGMGRGFGNGGMMGMMGHGMRPMPGKGMNIQHQGPGMRMFGNIPDLTDKQKKSMEELTQKQQDEMKKLRDEMMTKIKSLRDSHRAKIVDLLTPEQKKWFEENTGNPPK